MKPGLAPGVSCSTVVITGLGVVSPIGTGKETFWSNLLAGVNGVREIKSFDSSSYRTHCGGEVLDFDFSSYLSDYGTRRPVGRGAQFAIAAADQAWKDSGLDLDRIDPYRVGIAGGTAHGELQIFEAQHAKSFGREGPVVDRASGQGGFHPEAMFTAAAQYLGIKGPQHLFATNCAAGNYAIAYAADLLRARAVDVMLAGGVDPMSKMVFAGFNAMKAVAPERCQPFDLHRKGMSVSEGCAMLVLEPLQSALARNARIYAEVAGFGVSNDAFHATAPHPLGRGAITAMVSALSNASVLPEQIDYISAHGTGTPANDVVETRAVKKVFGSHAYRVPISSVKSMLGHAQGAASALEAAACVLAIDRGQIPPTINYEHSDPACDLDYVPNRARECGVHTALSNAFALGGNCSSLILRKHRP